MFKKALLFGLAVALALPMYAQASGRAADSGFVRTFSRG